MPEDIEDIGSDSWSPVIGEPSEVNRPIFVVGCHRSGTSMLRRSLDSHPRISVGPEDPTLFWLSRTDTDLTRERRAGYGYTEEEWLGMIHDLVEKVHTRYSANQGKTRWASKHPENARIINYLNRIFPTCQVIHIVRNPRDVLASSRRKFGPKPGAHYRATLGQLRAYGRDCGSPARSGPLPDGSLRGPRG